MTSKKISPVVKSRRAKAKIQSTPKDFSGVWNNLSQNPAIATAVLEKVASNLKTRYPEISNLLKENFDYLENKLGEFKDSTSTPQTGNQSTQASTTYNQ